MKSNIYFILVLSKHFKNSYSLSAHIILLSNVTNYIIHVLPIKKKVNYIIHVLFF